jgi:hypothetical protein
MLKSCFDRQICLLECEMPGALIWDRFPKSFYQYSHKLARSHLIFCYLDADYDAAQYIYTHTFHSWHWEACAATEVNVPVVECDPIHLIT